MSVLQQINKAQLKAHIIDLSHIDVTTIGKSLITKIIPGTGLIISNSTGADAGTGAVTLQLDDSLSSLANLTGTGLVTRLIDGSVVARSLEVSSNLTISNGDGVLGNPSLDLSNTGVTAGTYKYLTTDSKGRITSGYKFLDHWVANEILIDSGDHINYTISNTPVTSATMIFVSGAKQTPGSDKDYTINGTTVTFTSPNLAIDVITACYYWNEINASINDNIHEVIPAFDGTRQRFRLSYLPIIDSQVVFLNGLLQRPGNLYDYTMEGQDIVFIDATDTTDIVSALYMR